MFDPKTLDQLVKELVARILPQLQNVNGQSKPLPRLLTVKQAAVYLGRVGTTGEPSESAIYHLVAKREIPVVRHGRNLRFDRIALDRWLESDRA